MRVHTRHTPGFGVARVLLAPGEAVQAAAESLLASSFNVAETNQNRGRKGGRSVFTAPQEGGWVDLAPLGPGDVYPLELTGSTGWSVHREGVLARPSTVRVDQNWAPLQQLFGADSGFLEHYSGRGPLLLTAPGPVDSFDLGRGEIVTVRPDYLLAYPDTVQCRLRALDPSGPQSLRTGEGLVLDFAGPGTVLVQSRNRRVSQA
ncbi:MULTISPECIES: AIM24 family protein [Amycolatopsis]|uniref:AIM24 family protein n=1 Tax=Amycolatopsis dendrobii TaxID=2760662 RepID=A0A7W3W6R1_9PSEU|nr:MULTISPECIES: AIM24 family protein [Amycolatopsis]MBB1159815.1 AIM24 family protein [Amycolatopsis dendrobii]UKD52531.1 AIM24 family protein [Amycolatopsis sp. FU40]